MYKLTNTGVIVRISDVASIPLDPNNIDYQAYLLWLSEGGVPEEPDPELDPPISCTRRQGRLALLRYGYLEKVEEYIEAIEDPQEKLAAKIEYEAETWESTNKFVVSIWAAISGPNESLRELFLLAVTL